MLPHLKTRWSRIPILNKLVVGFCLGLFSLALLFAPEPQPVRLDEVGFSTKAPDLLYFKNVRSYYYRLTEDETSGFHLYRNKGFAFPQFEEPLRLMIVHNWRNDEAFIFFELQDSLKTASVVWDGLETPLLLHNQNTEQQFIIAALLYNALLAEKKIFLVEPGRKHKLFEGHRYKRAVLVSLEDYFKLVGKAKV